MIEEAKALAQRLRDSKLYASLMVMEAAGTIYGLVTEIERLRLDAKRWKWIQENIYSYPYDDHGMGPEFDLSNETIDAAMRENKHD